MTTINLIWSWEYFWNVNRKYICTYTWVWFCLYCHTCFCFWRKTFRSQFLDHFSFFLHLWFIFQTGWSTTSLVTLLILTLTSLFECRDYRHMLQYLTFFRCPIDTKLSHQTCTQNILTHQGLSIYHACIHFSSTLYCARNQRRKETYIRLKQNSFWPKK